MADYDNEQKTELFSVEDHEKYLIYSRTEISRVLNELSKRPDIITAYFNGGKEYLLTAVLAVLPDRELVVLDYGPDERTNRRVLDAERLICVTKHNNIDIRFNCTTPQRAKFQEKQAFAAPIPESLFRLQRREFFRVSTPITSPVVLQIPQEEGTLLELNVADLSCGGLGLLDPDGMLPAEPLTELKGCVLFLPDETLTLDLQIRNRIRHTLRDGRQVTRIGCAFVNLPLNQNAVIQRYIHRLQVEQKGLSQS